MVAGNLLKVIFTHLLDDKLPILIHRSKWGNMQTSIDAAHIIPALDLVHGEIGKGYRVLVTATRD
jgi:hypothetical protein